MYWRLVLLGRKLLLGVIAVSINKNVEAQVGGSPWVSTQTLL
jgi:hypothetical protein